MSSSRRSRSKRRASTGATGTGEIFRWQGVPTEDAADVHFRKDL